MRLQRSLPRRAGCGAADGWRNGRRRNLQRSLPRRAECGLMRFDRCVLALRPFNEACPEGQDAAGRTAGCTGPARTFNEACPEGQDAAQVVDLLRRHCSALQRSLPRRAGSGPRRPAFF